ncbi:LytS/YehU family sensor histidine kinase [Pedobacter sp. W3I1]|uniref:sensor histidine kinase n=1 Tax=Pedobacter sp. W3I1 TaxID=3042291 RepID=UPI00277D4909|nr:sensor histidine kinase [Pedobacter sp. W3I1]MDQ0641601.1 LytS/YehU family sensor histidine kinase [Pedobacter sp. W3I1]
MPPPPWNNNFENRPHKPMFNRFGGPNIDIISIFLFLIIVIIGFTQETNKQLRLTTQRFLQAEAEKAHAELSFLKAQVNPHFLFNTLNNIYTLAIIKDENTAPSIMKLSNIMRYITDEAGCDFVSLQSEVDCITNFIALQKLRLTKKTDLNYELTGNFENKKIAPLILMAFVENVFKYGISNHKSNSLTIKINVQNSSINFYCQNTIYRDKKNTERTGIGIENTKQRLRYIYGDKHILNIKDNDGLFTVNLAILL